MSTWTPPRRICQEKLTPAELAICAAMEAVERAGCDVLLTEAVILLSKARDKVADFVDGAPSPTLGDELGALRELEAAARLESTRGFRASGRQAINRAIARLDSLRGGKPPTKSDLVSTKLVGDQEGPIRGGKEGT